MARKKTKRKKGQASNAAPEIDRNRRKALGKIATYVIGGAVVVGGGGAFAMDFRRKLVEHDLSVLGQGMPVILQIHDPQCSMCTELQRQTRKALRSLDTDTVLYRVANIRTPEGAAIQAREALPHVTLVLYDGEGNRLHVIQGVTPASDLEAAFRKYLDVPTA